VRLNDNVWAAVRGLPGRTVAAPASVSTATRGRRLLALSVLLVTVLSGSVVATGAASAASPTGTPALQGKLHLRKRALGAGKSATRSHWACPEGACDAIIAPRPVRKADGYALPQGGRLLEGGGELGGLDPAELRSAYNIPTSGGASQTIALIDAFGYPAAEADLATYRAAYGLPPCTKKNGCFEKVNEQGGAGDYPAAEPGWDGEAALDEDMASAACPECHILLVEGSGEFPEDLGEAVDTAARLGATEISNSYGYPEQLKEFCGTNGCSRFDKDYSHPGALILASAGDAGFEDTYSEEGLQTNFPAGSPNVVAVGGTALHKDAGNARGWQEEVWNELELHAGTGGGCTKFDAKPSWQADSGCADRTDNDVAAVAAVETGVSVRIDHRWEVFGGTSVASPLVAGIEAHASSAVRSLGAEAFYENPGSLFDVTEGFNWDPLDGHSECAPHEYLCNAEVGYDGPTGLGTPDGVIALNEQPPPPTVTQISPKRGPATGGTLVTITGSGLTGATEVDFGTVQARELKVESGTSITAESPAGTVGTVDVTVTTPGGRSATSSKDRFKYKQAKG
jgi:IPT/TIG domain/Subtilase family